MYSSINYDEQEILDLYEKHESAKPVAAAVGVSAQTVYRVLDKHGVKRTHRHEKQTGKAYRPSGCNTKYCPAFVVMLRTVLNMRTCEIMSATGYSSSAVGNIITRHGLTDKRRRRDIDEAVIDVIEEEYLAGASTYELGSKYGVCHQTITKWMKERGHVRGKGWSSGAGGGLNKGHYTQRANAIAKYEAKLAELSGGSVSLVSYSDMYNILLQCNVCGHIFKRQNSTHNRKPRCPKCHEIELSRKTEERAREKQKQAALREAEYRKPKICQSCGAVFHSEHDTALYCSDTCRRREKRHRDAALGKMKLKAYSNHRKRARERGVAYEPGITLRKLVERDKNICQICGKPCDISDTEWGHCGPMYPSIDHIKPMALGGPHTWDNVQLAHCICNSHKRDIWEVSA